MKKTLSLIGNIIIWVFVAFAVLTTVLVFTMQSNQDGLPSIGGKCLITIVSDSMSPTFKAGDLLIADRLTGDDKAALKKGDVITYITDLNEDGIDEVNTHRITASREENGYVFYKTKGDNTVTNPVEDKNEVVHSNVIAQWNGKKLTGVGTVMNFLQTPTGFLIVIVLPLVLFFLFELYHFIIVIVTNKKGKLSPEDEEMIKQQAIAEYLKQQKATDASASKEADASDAPDVSDDSDDSDEPKDNNQ